MKVKRYTAAFLAFIMLFSFGVLAEEPAGFEPMAENERFTLLLNKETGDFYTEDKETGQRFYSTPEQKDTDALANGIFKMQLFSQLLITYTSGKGDVLASADYSSSVLSKGLSVEPKSDGFVLKFDFKDEKIIIPLSVSLQKDGLSAEVVASGISEYGVNRLLTVSVLPFFGAGYYGEDGYMAVPDGSGALINFKRSKDSIDDYRQTVYNKDYALTQDRGLSLLKTAGLPVFGVNKDKNGFIAVLTGAAETVDIKASTAGIKTSYNHIYAEFVYRPSETFQMLSKTSRVQDVTAVSEKPQIEGNFGLSYMFLEAPADYSAMARRYRKYLAGEQGVGYRPSESAPPLFLDIICGVKVQKYFFGFPYEAIEKMTTFKEVREIIDSFLDAGVERLSVTLKGWTKDGLDNRKVSSKPEPAAALGGKNGLKELIAYASSRGVTVVPEEDFTSVRDGGGKYVVKGVSKLTSVRYDYLKDTGLLDTASEKVSFLNPLRVKTLTEKYIEEFKEYQSGLSLSSLGGTLYSDFSKSTIFRGNALNIREDIFKAFKDTKLSFSAPMAYALPYAAEIREIPVSSSRFDAEDRDIPFYAMAVSGIAPYSVPSVNLSDYPGQMCLKALETGAGLLYTLSFRSPDKIRFSEFNDLYGIWVDDWRETAIEDYLTLKPVMENFTGAVIASHSELSPGVFVTNYDNGKSVVVNYGSAEAQTPYGTVGSLGWLVAAD